MHLTHADIKGYEDFCGILMLGRSPAELQAYKNNIDSYRHYKQIKEEQGHSCVAKLAAIPFGPASDLAILSIGGTMVLASYALFRYCILPPIKWIAREVLNEICKIITNKK